MQTIMLKDACNIFKGKGTEPVEGGSVPIHNIGSIWGYTDKGIANEPLIAIASQGTVGKPRYFDTPVWISGTQIYITAKEGIDLRYIFSILDCIDWKEYENPFSVRGGMNIDYFEKIKVPILPLSKQKEIASNYFMLLKHIREEEEIISTLQTYKNVLLDGMFVNNKDEVKHDYYQLDN